MTNDDERVIARMVPMLRKVLVVDSNPASGRLLSELMRDLTHSQVWTAISNIRGMTAMEQVQPQLILVDLAADGIDGLKFARDVRRSEAVCRKVPIIMVTATATAGAIMGARDAGIHEFLRKPFTTRDLLRRLEAVTLRSRDWVEAVGYIGPDRRRFNSGDYSGALKRQVDPATTPDEIRILQALKIIRSAIDAAGRDPEQVLRALLAQSVNLRVAAQATSNAALGSAAIEFQRYLDKASDGQQLRPDDLEAKAALLLGFLPKVEPERGTAA